MEQKPNIEQPLSFEEELALARALTDAVDRRNQFIAGYGGFDNFAESWGNLTEPRAEYDKYEDAYNQARKEFDEKVLDKAGFVKKAREIGNGRIVDDISMMFGVAQERRSKEKFFSRIFNGDRK